MRLMPTDPTDTKTARMYLDSQALAAQLRAEVSEKLLQKNSQSVLHVPMLVLLLEREHPVLIDGHYLARAAGDMVLAVHNKQVRGATGCLNRLIHFNVQSYASLHMH
jgi:hypothetical protein